MASSAFISLNNKTQNVTMMISTASSLPSPPISSRQKIPTFMVDRAPSPCHGSNRGGSVSDARSTSTQNRRRDVEIDDLELRPFLFNHQTDRYCLPPIQNVIDINTPTASPSPPFESYCTSSASPISSVASSPTPLDEDEVEDDEQRQKQQHMMINIRRKGSIASLLNSDPELRQLDEEENKCNYQSHFIDNNMLPQQPYYQLQPLNSLKRGRPRQDHIELIYNHNLPNKKQCRYNNTSNKVIITKEANNTTQLFSGTKYFHEYRSDCLQACQSQSNSTNKTNNNQVHVETVSSTNEPTRATKGLRHFSKQVCDKVAEKGMTTYNEVADELAFDIQNSVGNDKHTYDQKNIRRRVYDALNVLMAMDIIAKEKKVIKWLGTPEYYKQEDQDIDEKECETDNKEHESRLSILKQIEQEELRQNELMGSLHLLRGVVNDKLQKHLQIRNLISRNQDHETKDVSQRISLPFFMIACSSTAINDIHINMSSDSRFATVSFKNKSINDINVVYEDADVLKHLYLNDKISKSSSNKKPVCSLLQQPYQQPSTPWS